MKITIHQPEHMPWLGLIDKINQADIFVVLDIVQFEKNNFQNRNKIRTNSKNGYSWLTIPIKKHKLDTKIKDIEISYDFDWQKQYLNKIKENYKDLKNFNKYFSIIEKIILKKYKKLIDLNLEILNFILKEFDIKTKILKASDLGLPEIKKGSNEIIISICKELKGNKYLSGIGGKNYLKPELFEKENIKIIFQEFKHPIYKQQYPIFLEKMSSIDFLFNQK
jgi:hypothetical protein